MSERPDTGCVPKGDTEGRRPAATALSPDHDRARAARSSTRDRRLHLEAPRLTVMTDQQFTEAVAVLADLLDLHLHPERQRGIRAGA
ncbi:hypothetical protein [Frankia sp. CiP3]|uniref:hypothetical protein n=1 Tax=Frankia sp. CiP3 TaxID=2880971 RepID=UPI001EF5DE6B|nr:hypothetical protein [Frankia sp. CiP3]